MDSEPSRRLNVGSRPSPRTNRELPDWMGFNHGPVTLRGGRATIHQGQIFRVAGRETNWSPSYRFITDLAQPTTRTTLAGGPSDRRFSRSYASDVADWVAGRFKTLTKTG